MRLASRCKAKMCPDAGLRQRMRKDTRSLQKQHEQRCHCCRPLWESSHHHFVCCEKIVERTAINRSAKVAGSFPQSSAATPTLFQQFAQLKAAKSPMLPKQQSDHFQAQLVAGQVTSSKSLDAVHADTAKAARHCPRQVVDASCKHWQVGQSTQFIRLPMEKQDFDPSSVVPCVAIPRTVRRSSSNCESVRGDKGSQHARVTIQR